MYLAGYAHGKNVIRWYGTPYDASDHDVHLSYTIIMSITIGKVWNRIDRKRDQKYLVSIKLHFSNNQMETHLRNKSSNDFESKSGFSKWIRKNLENSCQGILELNTKVDSKWIYKILYSKQNKVSQWNDCVPMGHSPFILYHSNKIKWSLYKYIYLINRNISTLSRRRHTTLSDLSSST